MLLPNHTLTDTKGQTLSFYSSEGKSATLVCRGRIRSPDPHLNVEQAREVLRWLGIDRSRIINVTVTRNENGLPIFGEAFRDQSGSEVWVQGSSAAGEACCWICVDDGDKESLNTVIDLSVDGKWELAYRLWSFIER